MNLSLGFFFLMFSAAEITVGLALFLTTLGLYGTLLYGTNRLATPIQCAFVFT